MKYHDDEYESLLFKFIYNFLIFFYNFINKNKITTLELISFNIFILFLINFFNNSLCFYLFI